LAFAPPHLALIGAYAAAGAFGAVLPDIDSRRSWVGRKVRIMSDVIEHVAGHRRLFHSLAGMAGLVALVYILLRIYHPAYLILLVPFLVGYLSHLVLDTVAGGVPWLYPLVKKRVGLTLKTDGAIERWLLRPILVVVMLFTAYHALAPIVGHTISTLFS